MALSKEREKGAENPFRDLSPHHAQVNKAQRETVTTDPDQEWAVHKNPDYDHLHWLSTADGSWEKRLAKESPLDSFSGINWKKMGIERGEYYGVMPAPAVEYQWDEDEFYRQLQPAKSDEQVQTELGEPRQKLLDKVEEFESMGAEVIWTPTMAAMTNTQPLRARAIEYELSPYYQLNRGGFRKNWANIRVVEYRPFQRLFHSNFWWMFTDHFWRFQIMRWNMSGRIRLRYFRFVMGVGALGIVIDHLYARQYRRGWKWH